MAQLVKIGTGAALDDPTAESLARSTGSRFHKAISDVFGPAVAAQMAADGTIAAAAVTAMSDAAVQAQLKWSKMGLGSTTHADTLYGQPNMAAYRIQTSTIATDIGMPTASPGILTVHWVRSTSGNDTMQVWEPWTGGRWTRRFTTVWSAWQQDPVWARGPIANGTDLNALRFKTDEGVWEVRSASVAATLLNLPTGGAGLLTVKVTGSTNVAMQQYETYGSTGGVYWRQIETPSSGTWGPWKKAATTDDITGGGSSGSGAHVGIANDLLKQDFSRRRGGRIKTGGKGAVALRFDHGLASVKATALPLCQARGIVPSIAINSRNWGYAENAGITQAEVDAWVAAGDVEIWNHSATHSNPTTVAAIHDEVVTGLAELRAQLPAAEIDGFVLPGVGADPTYMGFNNGRSVQAFYGTEAGRIILGSHAISTGYIPGTHQTILDGTIRQGGHQFTLDQQTLAAAKAEVDYAIANKTGLQLMLHPSQLDLADRITTADFTALLDYIVAKRDAGDLVVLSPYDMVLADAT